tara:strand:+ start:412 stop:756 length:345 start_codon:yes stop_codon:yes gene_type:complete
MEAFETEKHPISLIIEDGETLWMAPYHCFGFASMKKDSMSIHLTLGEHEIQIFGKNLEPLWTELSLQTVKAVRCGTRKCREATEVLIEKIEINSVKNDLNGTVDKQTDTGAEET